MRIAEVIGTVTLARAHPALAGSRFVIGVPLSLAALKVGRRGDGEDLVIVDELGASPGGLIGVSEGLEAAAPFYPAKRPVDAYVAALLDTVSIHGDD